MPKTRSRSATSNNPHKLLQEAVWVLDAEKDPGFSRHMLADLKGKLRTRIERVLESHEADSLWEGRDPALESRIASELPEGWQVRLRKPSQQMRFSATSPGVNGHRVVLLADTPDDLIHWVNRYVEFEVSSVA